MPRILVLRGHVASPWELAPWRELPERFDVSLLLSRSNRFDAPAGLSAISVRTLRDALPAGLAGELVAGALGDRYLSAEQAFAEADVVHAEELGFWFSADAARRRRKGQFALAQTIWETLPLLNTYRNRHARAYRRRVLANSDLFLPTTRRAAQALRLEGVPDEKIRVCEPGVDVQRFGGVDAPKPEAHTVLSPGRLVWEKGHHDVIRALALLHRGDVRRPDGSIVRPRLAIVGSGPEERRLGAYAAELGLAESVAIRAVPYAAMPQEFAAASAMVLASQGSAWGSLGPLGAPRAFWEEQFGLVLAEAMAAGLAIVASTSGAIPEVLENAPADLVAPGDWVGIAQALASGPLARPPAARVTYPSAVVQRYSTTAAAARLAEAYDGLLQGG